MFVCISLAWWLSLSCWLPAPVSLDSLYRVFFLVNLGKKWGLGDFLLSRVSSSRFMFWRCLFYRIDALCVNGIQLPNVSVMWTLCNFVFRYALWSTLTNGSLCVFDWFFIQLSAAHYQYFMLMSVFLFRTPLVGSTLSVLYADVCIFIQDTTCRLFAVFETTFGTWLAKGASCSQLEQWIFRLYLINTQTFLSVNIYLLKEVFV